MKRCRRKLAGAFGNNFIYTGYINVSHRNIYLAYRNISAAKTSIESITCRDNNFAPDNNFNAAPNKFQLPLRISRLLFI